jgi:hypothetical protein
VVRAHIRLVRVSVRGSRLCRERAGIGRLDFADSPAFHSMFESRASQSLEAQSASSISAKMRVAIWTSGSTLPAHPETLVAIQPSALPQVEALQPNETITAKPVHSAYLEKSPSPHQSAKRKRLKPRVFVDPPDNEDDGPSSFLDYQRRALSNRADLDDAEVTGENMQPSFLGGEEHTKQSDSEADSQPSLLGRIFSALVPW